mmetsp:Transcript_60323/g.83835  ORF Transcript_60323/g.83835 Transcript_60323/m.83835 type:complete len:115 (-) Transcript_60323:70-414(-)
MSQQGNLPVVGRSSSLDETKSNRRGAQDFSIVVPSIDELFQLQQAALRRRGGPSTQITSQQEGPSIPPHVSTHFNTQASSTVSRFHYDPNMRRHSADDPGVILADHFPPSDPDY